MLKDYKLAMTNLESPWRGLLGSANRTISGCSQPYAEKCKISQNAFIKRIIKREKRYIFSYSHCVDSIKRINCCQSHISVWVFNKTTSFSQNKGKYYLFCIAIKDQTQTHRDTKRSNRKIKNYDASKHWREQSKTIPLIHQPIHTFFKNNYETEARKPNPHPHDFTTIPYPVSS